MRKIKLAILSIAIILATAMAFVTRPRYDCTQVQNYYYTNGNYLPAGTFGENYYCSQSGNVCTYTLIQGTYVNCRNCTFVCLGTEKYE